MKKLIFIFVLFTTLVYSQGSLNILGSYQQGQPQLAISGVFEDKNFLFEGQILANNKVLSGIIKAGSVIARNGRSRFIISPKLISNIRTNKFKVAIVPEWNGRFNKFTISVGVDCKIVKGRSFTKNESVNIEKTTLYPAITPSLSIQYLMYGKRYLPKKKKTQFEVVNGNYQKIKHSIWDDGTNGYALFTKPKVTAYAIIALAGYVDGFMEAYSYGGRTAFEKRWNVDPYSYAGSKSYIGQKERTFKTDFYHNGEDARVGLYITGSITLGYGGAKINKKFKHYVYDALIAWGIKAATKNMGMNLAKTWNNSF